MTREGLQGSDLIPAALEAAAVLAAAARHRGLPPKAREKCGRVSDRLSAAIDAEPIPELTDEQKARLREKGIDLP